jgi:hypothetical protein
MHTILTKSITEGYNRVIKNGDIVLIESLHNGVERRYVNKNGQEMVEKFNAQHYKEVLEERSK